MSCFQFELAEIIFHILEHRTGCFCCGICILVHSEAAETPFGALIAVLVDAEPSSSEAGEQTVCCSVELEVHWEDPGEVWEEAEDFIGSPADGVHRFIPQLAAHCPAFHSYE